MKQAYKAYLAKLLGVKYLADHPEIVNTWWKAGIAGGMFRAGVRYGRKTP